MTKGKRMKPRVALVGNFSQMEMTRFLEIFPTVWTAKDFSDLSTQIDYKEIDLLIVGNNFRILPNWHTKVHVICFCPELPDGFLGPNNSWIRSVERSRTEEFDLPKLPLNFDRLRKADLAKVDNLKSQPLIQIEFNAPDAVLQRKDSLEIFKNSALFSDPHSNKIYALIYLREDPVKGIAWLPLSFLDKAEWCYHIAREWAKKDKDSFESFNNWEDDKEWMSLSELELINNIEYLEKKKEDYIKSIDQEISKLNKKYSQEKNIINNSIRKLLTTQGNELVDIIASCLSEIGFIVHKIDDQVTEGQPRREDLRLSLPQSDWEAIVEVRGYAKSSGTTADLLRLNRFNEFYFKEKNKFPDKRIYIVNGQIELPPNNRNLPFESSIEDIQIFSENDGLIISSIALYGVMKNISRLDLQEIINSITKGNGLWKYLPK